MKVFLAGTSLRLEYGGPAYSVSRLALALSEAGAHVGIWAADNSALNTTLLSPDSPVRRLGGTAREALVAFGNVDVLHDNGIWWAHNHRLAQLTAKRGIPRVVSTRGMLEPWAMKHKGSKKRIAWWLYQRRDLARARCHHATSEVEAKSLERLSLGVPVEVIANGIDLPGLPLNACTSSCKHRTAVFLGRLYPVKGLPMLIEAWSRVRPQGWRLRIAGPDEAGHRTTLEKAVSAARLEEYVSFVGPVAGDEKRDFFYNADLFVLPTHSESFGVAIAEALAHGLPVLTTTRAPWPMLSERGFGWWVDPSVDGIADGLRQATSLDSTSLQAMGEKGRTFVAEEFNWKQVAKHFVSVYESVIARTINKLAKNSPLQRV